MSWFFAPRWSFGLVGAVLLLGGFFLVVFSGEESKNAGPAGSTPGEFPSSPPLQLPPPPVPAGHRPGHPPEEDFETAAEHVRPLLQHIEELSTTYDAAIVPSLAFYLQHPEPLVRASAVEGLIQLGERAAIPFLESASVQVPSEEAVRFIEAAEFLALPTWTERLEEIENTSSPGRPIGR